jgi:hypothetical protein
MYILKINIVFYNKIYTNVSKKITPTPTPNINQCNANQKRHNNNHLASLTIAPSALMLMGIKHLSFYISVLFGKTEIVYPLVDFLNCIYQPIN